MFGEMVSKQEVLCLLMIASKEQKKYFEQKYKIYFEIKKQAIICSRILISIQVNIPNLVIKGAIFNEYFF